MTQRLDALFSSARSLDSEPEIQSHWARYLCVLTAGFVEQGIRTIVSEYCRHKASPQVLRFVQARLHKFQNPKMGKILEIVGQFDNDWKVRLEAQCLGELKDAIDSIMANRNSIAHGRDTNIGLVSIRDYYQRAKRVLEHIEQICLN